ncbi:hypothetical protein [Rhodococcus sp. IEGM 1408]|uniref:hypothetical protein n=1 Tax=Rhodococcus sp. IEGM 1408 TaxID=3082220 RepID=UPI002955CD34|nr:hypothetical protein [Rhodococcus sp. IEGM 1408]MDV8000428.1 hypothetical protein [Rhodococcus sp. IEGM 1408]
MPSTSSPPVSRRRFVASTVGVAGLVVAGGCALPTVDDEPDPLLRLAAAAERDALELGAADASHGEDAARLRRVADARRVHAEQLSAEIRRLAPEAAPTNGVEPTPPAVCPPIGEVRIRLRDDAKRAAEVAVASRGHRAALASSVSAACTAAVEVALA